MRHPALIVIAVLCLSCTVMGKEKRAREEGRARPATETTAEDRCEMIFARAVHDGLRLPKERFVEPALTAFAQCPALLGELAAAAKEASGHPLATRARTLFAGAKESIHQACSSVSPEAPAITFPSYCRPSGAEELVFSEDLLRDLDTGTFVYALSVRRALERSNAHERSGSKLVDMLIIGAALEGHGVRAAHPAR